MANNRDVIIQFLRGKGVPDHIIYGILGNLQIESGLNPGASNAGEGAIGLGQWEGGRRVALQNYAARHGGKETDLNIQLGYMWHEMNGSESGAWNRVKSASSVQDAAALWDQFYERSSGDSRQARVDAATQFAGGHGPSGETHRSLTADPMSSSKATTADFSNVDGLGRLLQQVPALSKLVQQAVSGNWTVDKFQNEVENSAWYKNHSGTARAMLIQQANDPSSYQQSLNNTISSLTTLSRQLGMGLNAKELQAIATHALLTGNDNNQQWLTQEIGRREDYSKLTDLGGLQGGMANTAQQLQSLAADYGHTWSAADVAQRAQQILVGNQTIDTYKQRLTAWAKSAFPSLAKELDSGTTVKELADPYVQSMSHLLEVDPSTLNTYTPMIRKALQGQRAKADADPTAIPLWKFEEQVRNDPRWQFTQNAKDSMSSALVKIGQDFGFGI